MRHAILPSMCAVAVAASCSPALAQQAAPAAAASPAYLNTERGLRVKTLEGRAISPSLMKGMRPHPTYNEGLMEALEDIDGKAVHTLPKKRK